MSDPKLLGMTRDFTFRSKVYKVGPRDFEQEALFRVWLEGQALDAVKRHRERMDPGEYQAQLAGWRQDAASGVYSYGSPLGAQAMFSEAGMKYLAYLSLAKHNPDVTPQLVDAIYDDAEAWGELCAVLGALNDPNRQAPPKAEAPAA